MTREEMLLRFGYYCGGIGRLLGDYSYAERWCGRCEELTEVDYMRETTEIQGRLVAAGLLGSDEDPYEALR